MAASNFGGGAGVDAMNESKKRRNSRGQEISEEEYQRKYVQNGIEVKKSMVERR